MYGPASARSETVLLQRSSPYGAGLAQNGVGKPNGESAATPSSNLYITGLPSPELDQASLHLIFEQFGLCVARSKTIPDTRGSGSSAALVQLASTAEAERAIAELHGNTLAGQTQAMCVVFASSRPGSERKSGGSGASPLMVKYAGADSIPSDNLYIAGLPSPQADASALEELFASLGMTIVRSKIIPDTRGSGSSAAMVQLASQEEAANALATLSGQVIHGLAAPAVGAAASLYPPAVSGGPVSVSAPVTSQALIRPLETPVQDLARSAARAPAAGSTNLYLTGLPSPEVEQASLNSMFEQLGLTVVRSRVIPDTKGFGTSAAMVQVASSDQAEKAIAELNGQILAGCDQPLSVAHARDQSGSGAVPANDGFSRLGTVTPMAPIMPVAPVAPVVAVAPVAPTVAPVVKIPPPLMVKYAGSDSTPSDNLYISGLPSPQADPEALHELFTGLGLTIVRFRIIPDTRGSGSSAAMIQLAAQEEAATALALLNGQVVQGLQSAPPITVQSSTSAAASTTPITVQSVASVAASAAAAAAAAAAARSAPLVARGAPPTARSAAGGTPMLVKYSGGEGAPPSDNLYISGLPSPQVDPILLNRLFASLGLSVVRSKIIADTRRIGSSAAMVQLASHEEASAAIAHLNGEVFSTLDVLQEVALDTTSWVLKYVGGPLRPSDTIRITGLPSPAPDIAIVRQVFEDLGLNVVQVRISPDSQGGATSSSAILKLGSQEEASSAIVAFSGSETDIASANPIGAYPVQQDMESVPAFDLDAVRVKYVGSSGAPSDNLYISGLPAPQCDQAQLLGIFEELGLNVVRSKIIPDTQGRGSSAAMVQLASQEQAATALSALTRAT